MEELIWDFFLSFFSFLGFWLQREWFVCLLATVEKKEMKFEGKKVKARL